MSQLKLTAILPLVLLTACASNELTTLIYAKNVSFGANITSVSGTSPNINVGFNSQNIALVPVLNGDEVITGSVGQSNPQDKDALSVLGQFNSSANGSSVSLGEFFATGVAAQKLADGFACQVSSNGAKQLCDN